MAIAACVLRLFSLIQDGLRPLIPMFILIAYTLAGAALFILFERSSEEERLRAVQADYWKLFGEVSYNLSRRMYRDEKRDSKYVNETLERFREGLGVSAADPTQIKWTWTGSIFYTLTVYTTIGDFYLAVFCVFETALYERVSESAFVDKQIRYGSIYPVTRGGQIFTIVYAFFGIPLALITLIGLGSLFARCCKLLWKIVIHSIAKSTSIVSKDIEMQVKKLSMVRDIPKNNKNNDDDLLSFPVSFLIGITIVWVFLCAALFTFIEGEWNYFTSLYFTLISFTTIGFGDVMPSDSDYMIIVGLCVLIGLSLVSTVLTIIQQQIEAIGTKMDKDIDKNYMEALQSAYDAPDRGAERQGSEADVAIDKTNLHIDSIVSKMSLKDRILYRAMSDSNKSKMREKADKKMSMRVMGTQTVIETSDVDIQTQPMGTTVQTHTEPVYLEPEPEERGRGIALATDGSRNMELRMHD